VGSTIEISPGKYKPVYGKHSEPTFSNPGLSMRPEEVISTMCSGIAKDRALLPLFSLPALGSGVLAKSSRGFSIDNTDKRSFTLPSSFIQEVVKAYRGLNHRSRLRR